MTTSKPSLEPSPSSLTNPTKDELIEAHRSAKNWLSFWITRLLELGIRVPNTILVPLAHKDVLNWIYNKAPLPASFTAELHVAAKKIGYPVFIRTDEASGKFEWSDMCYVEKEEKLLQNVTNVLEFNEEADMMGLTYGHIAVREYLPLDHKFTAYKGMPVGQEYRIFADNGKYVCHHPYWYPEVFESRMHSHKPPLPDNWKELLAATYSNEQDINALKTIAETVTKALGGYWSVDMLRAKNSWYVSDMALGLSSHHYEKCENRLKVDLEYA